MIDYKMFFQHTMVDFSQQIIFHTMTKKLKHIYIFFIILTWAMLGKLNYLKNKKFKLRTSSLTPT